jgi:hypothetical protein
MLFKYETDLEPDVLASFSYMFNSVKQPDLVITADMVNNFNVRCEAAASMVYKKHELEDENGKQTELLVSFRRVMAREYLPQFDTEKLVELAKQARIEANKTLLLQKASSETVDGEDLKSIENNTEETMAPEIQA